MHDLFIDSCNSYLSTIIIILLLFFLKYNCTQVLACYVEYSIMSVYSLFTLLKRGKLDEQILQLA